MTFDLSNVVNKSSASKALARSGIKTTDSSKNTGTATKLLNALNPIPEITKKITSLFVGEEVSKAYNMKVDKLEAQIAPTQGALYGGALGFSTAGPAGVIPGAYAGVKVGGAVGGVSLLEQLPKTSPIVKEIEQKTGSKIEELGGKALLWGLEHPGEVLFGAGITVAGASLAYPFLKPATTIASNLQQTQELKSSIENITPSAGGKKIKDRAKNLIDENSKDIPKSPINEGNGAIANPSPIALTPSTATLNAPAMESTSLTPTGNMTPILNKKRYKRRKPKEPIKVSQRVNIALVNANRNIYKHHHA